MFAPSAPYLTLFGIFQSRKLTGHARQVVCILPWAVSNKDEFAKQVREVPQSCVRRLDTNFIHKGGHSRQVSGV